MTKVEDPPRILLEVSDKVVIQRAAATYLEQAEPAEVSLFETVFEPAFKVLENSEMAGSGKIHWDDGKLRASSPFGEETAVGAVLWITTQLTRALLESPADSDPRTRLEALGRQLAEYSRQSERVEGITAALADSEELRRLRASMPPVPPAAATEGSERPEHLLLIDARRDGEHHRLSYILRSTRSGRGESYDRFASVTLDKDPEAFLHRLYREIEQLSRRRKISPRLVQERLAGIGVTLWERFLPHELRRRLGALHSSAGSPSTLFLISNETWIPWEVLKIGSPDAPWESSDTPFLSETFAMTRWLFDLPQTLELPLRRIALVMPGSSTLPNADAEYRFLHDQASDHRRIINITARYEDLVEALASGRFDGWHFTGHGFVRGTHPDFWSLELDHKEQLQAIDLRNRARGLGRARPLVFLNACRSGRGGLTLTGLGDLGHAFLTAGAGAFVGCRWALRDRKALFFAKTFYELFLAGCPLAESVRQARVRLRDGFPDDPAWLVYTVYAHPLARIRDE